jgi:diguanylate cyclase (GGDEF)-like protein
LTGLLNARAFDRRLEQEIARAKRTGEPLSLMMFDLDGLKTINDAFGHETGSRALRRMGDIVRRSMRLTDVSARVGGDEFALIVPGAGRDETLKLAERIRAQVAEDLSRIAPGVDAGTTSIGIASCGAFEPVPTPGALTRAADSALYEAKRTGRNRVVVGRLDGNGDVVRAADHRRASAS